MSWLCQRNHLEFAYSLCNLWYNGTLHDTIFTDRDFTTREPLGSSLLLKSQGILRMLFKPLDVSDCHTQEDLGAESVNIRAVHRGAMPDRSPFFATNR